MKLPWMNGNKPRSIEDEAGDGVLALALDNPHAADTYQNNLEIKGAVNAITKTLPKRIQAKISEQEKVAIASVIILQRAAAYQEAVKDMGMQTVREEVPEESGLHSGVDTTPEKAA